MRFPALRRIPFRLGGCVLALAFTLTGAACGGSSARPQPRLAPAPEPAVSPPPEVRPAGRVVPVSGMPEGIAVARGVVAMAVRDPAGLALLDATRGTPVRRVALPGAARHIAVGTDGATLLVPEEPADRLTQVELPSGRVLRSTAVGRNPHDAIGTGPLTIVSDELGGRVSVLGRSGRTLATLGGFVQPAGIAVARGRFGVVDVRANLLAVYDTATLRRVATLPAGEGPTHVVADREGNLEVVDTRGGAILVFRLRPSPALIARFPLGGRPYGVAVDPRRDVLWVTLTARNRVVGLQLGGPIRPIVDLATVRQPNSVAVDPASGSVYVAGAGPDGGLQTLARPLAGR